MNTITVPAPFTGFLPLAITAPEVSTHLTSKYTSLNSAPIIAKLIEAGFVLREAKQTGKGPSAKHMVRLFHPNLVVPNEGHMEVVFYNSHDGSTTVRLAAGIIRSICANGLMVGLDIINLKLRHIGEALSDAVNKAVDSFIGILPLICDKVNQFKNRILTYAEQVRFANAAMALRVPDAKTARIITGRDCNEDLIHTDLSYSGKMDAKHLLQARREADEGQDLWRVLNVVQENLIRGGIQGPKRALRKIKSIEADTKINLGLWKIAASFIDNTLVLA